jgi:hypothetical protein
MIRAGNSLRDLNTITRLIVVESKNVLMLFEYNSCFLTNDRKKGRCERLTSNEIYCMYNFSRIIRSRTVLVVVIIIVYTHLYVTKKDEEERGGKEKKSD